MNLLEKLKESLKAHSEREKARKEIYDEEYEQQYKKELKKKAKKDAYNKVNGIRPEQKKSRIQIGLYGNDEEEKSAFSSERIQKHWD